MTGLANLLGRTREANEEFWLFRYANGLVVKTDPFMRRDRGRILPVGGPQDLLMNRLVHDPSFVRDKRVLDVFAGSGVLGLMALKLGATQVDFVDINPRASDFQRENCGRNGFAESRYRVITSSAAAVAVDHPYDVVLANPPFVPTPPGIEGTLTSRAGRDGNTFLFMLLERLDAMLSVAGEALLVLMQMESNGTPLICDRLAELVPGREFRFTPMQEQASDIGLYARAYRERFPSHADAIAKWEEELHRDHGGVQIQHYALHVGAQRPGPTRWAMVGDLATAYGEGFLYPAKDQYDLALGRVAENFVLP